MYTTQKKQIVAFLANKEWENSKHAYSVFCKEFPAMKINPLYFYRTFASNVTPVRKRESILGFLRNGNFESCKEAYGIYAVGEKKHTSFYYFMGLYTEVRKEKGTNRVLTYKNKPSKI